jgi:hypothetical protein
MKFNLLVFLLFLFVISLSSCHRRATDSGIQTKVSRCSFFLKENSNYWKRDSLGSNGFRSLAADTIQKMGCDFSGYSEETITSFFGEPNGKIDRPTGYLLRYQLTDYGYISHPGQKYMDIRIIKGGLVEDIRFWKVDG